MTIRFILLIACFVLSTGCIYRVDIQQGNEVTAEMMQQISVGMSQRDVAQILGLPLVNDPFNNNRWDYYYSFKSGKTKKLTQESSTLIFEQERLVSIRSTVSEATEE